MNPAEAESRMREDTRPHFTIKIRKLDKIETVVCSNSSGT